MLLLMVGHKPTTYRGCLILGFSFRFLAFLFDWAFLFDETFQSRLSETAEKLPPFFHFRIFFMTEKSIMTK